MKAVDSWSFRPYRPLLQPLKLPFICRLAPSETSVSLEWLGEPDAKILFRKKGQDEWSTAAAASGEAVLTGLSPDTDYEICAETASARGDIRLVRTGTYPGTVVNYLHPEDPVYGFSGHSLCSPSFVRCPQGHLLASMDVYASRAPQNLSLIFRSDDDGRTWHYVCDLFPCFWGRLFAIDRTFSTSRPFKIKHKVIFVAIHFQLFFRPRNKHIVNPHNIIPVFVRKLHRILL